MMIYGDDDDGGDDEDESRTPALMAHASRLSKWHCCRQQPPSSAYVL